MSELYLFRRWQSVCRQKAEQYEHPARKNGQQVISPSLDSLANEMEAYIAGRAIESDLDRVLFTDPPPGGQP